MTGGEKAAVIIALAVIGLVAFNVALWRRLRATIAAAKVREASAAGDPDNP